MEVFIILWVLMGVISAMIASGKGSNVMLYGILGFLLGPIGIILACVSKSEGEK